MNKISKAFHNKATGKSVIIVFISLVLFLGVSIPLLNVFAPQYMNMPILENPTIYSYTEIFDTVETWGQSGRIWQIVFHLTWDLVFPILVILFFGITISWQTKKAFNENSGMQNLNLIALLYSFDFLENITIEVLAISYPAEFKVIAFMKNILTAAKYASGIILILIVLIIFIKLFILKISRKKFNTSNQQTVS